MPPRRCRARVQPQGQLWLARHTPQQPPQDWAPQAAGAGPDVTPTPWDKHASESSGSTDNAPVPPLRPYLLEVLVIEGYLCCPRLPHSRAIIRGLLISWGRKALRR